MSNVERQREERQRAERLAAALRDNLKRRKSQTRDTEPEKPSRETD